jgi:hypothetical protein
MSRFPAAPNSVRSFSGGEVGHKASKLRTIPEPNEFEKWSERIARVRGIENSKTAARGLARHADTWSAAVDRARTAGAAGASIWCWARRCG